MKKILIVGGGASGMAAAISAAREGASVTLLEKKEQVGKKLSVTGNGRCNFSNLAMSADRYHGHDVSFAAKVLEHFRPEDAIAFMRSIGILETEKNGGLYPVNLQAQAVTSALLAEMKRLNVQILTGVNVMDLRKDKAGFCVYTDGETSEFRADAVILSCGSEAGVRDKKAFSAYGILKRSGHRIYPPMPVLVPLYGKNGMEEWWNGVRMTGSVSFNGRTERGELQMTGEGISGIPVFQISHVVGEALTKEREVTITLDLLPEYTESEICDFLLSGTDVKKAETYSAQEAFSGILPKKMIPVVLKKAGFKREYTLFDMTDANRIKLSEAARKLIHVMKEFPYTVYAAGDLAAAQAAAGGLAVSEVDDDMQSRKLSGLYVTGELLDIDGACGGYNLHFAWATGIRAGISAARGIKGGK